VERLTPVLEGPRGETPQGYLAPLEGRVERPTVSPGFPALHFFCTKTQSHSRLRSAERAQFPVAEEREGKQLSEGRALGSSAQAPSFLQPRVCQHNLD